MRRKTGMAAVCIMAAAIFLTSCQGSGRADRQEEQTEQEKKTGEETKEGETKDGEEKSEEELSSELVSEENGTEEYVDDWQAEKFVLNADTIIVPEGEVLDIPKIAKKDYPRVDGSTATLPLSMGLYRLSAGAEQDEAEKEISHTKTSNAYRGLLNGDADLVIAYEPSQAIYHEIEKDGADIDIRPIGKDALVFLTNEGNPVNSLSNEQIIDIYTGKLKNWSEVGGEDKEIIAFQRPGESGSQTLMKKMVMKDREFMEAPEDRVQGEMGDLIDAVASYNNEENALGYSVYYYAKNMYGQPGLRFMAVNGVMPDNHTIKSEEYPYVNVFYAAISRDKPKNSPEYRLFEWLTGENGQKFIERMGYVSVSGNGEASVSLQYENSVVPGAKIALEDQEYIAIDGMHALQVPGTLLIGQDGGHMEFIRNYRINEEKTLVIRKDQPILMYKHGETTDIYGVRDMAGDRWIVPPNGYYSIKNAPDGGYLAFGEEAVEYFDAEGTKLLQFKKPENEAAAVGDYIWSIDEAAGEAAIYDSEGKVFRTLDLSAYGKKLHLNSLEGSKICEIITENTFNECRALFYEDGTLFLDQAMIADDVREEMGAGHNAILSIWNRFTDGKVIEIQWGDESFAYDTEAKKLLTKKGDQVSFIWYKPVPYYEVRNEEETRLFDSAGKPMRTKNGQDYTRTVYADSFACLGNGTVTVGDGMGTEFTYRGPYDENSEVYDLGGNVFAVSYKKDGDERYHVFRGNEMIAGAEGNTVVAIAERGAILENRATGESVWLDEEGREKSSEERTLLKEELFTVKERGSFILVENEKGETVVRMLMGYMMND